MALTRTQISLSDDDRRMLDAAARRTGQSMSALIREAIHASYGATGDYDRTRSLIDVSFGVISIEVSGEDLVEKIRSGHRLTDLA